MKFTEKDLIAGETILIRKRSPTLKALYFGSAGLAHFVSSNYSFERSLNVVYTIQELNKLFTVQKPETLDVPLEQKVYDFVDVECNDFPSEEWHKNYKLVTVLPNNKYPYKVIDIDGLIANFRYCRFINK